MQDALRQEETGLAHQGRAGDARGAQRFTLLIRAAKLITAQGEFLCVIRDASEGGMSARIFHEVPQGREMLVELQNGDRHRATVVWQAEDRAGFQFASPADVARIIQSPSDFSKRPIRLNLSAAAEVHRCEHIDDVTITNISQQGASITCNTHYAIDQQVMMRIGRMHDAQAKVRWRDGRQVGLVFENTMQFGELARIARWLQRNN
ncbi:PilZ domain-containing protein [Aurantiacibacter gangjinensis]|uniref:Uncharacterized protein n=1 Tax=Aurantiacibacter gangjinensis TaxID=502682 RepID=A0A0G9MSA0_9SPHN|nr:PilZ domain-containing protein [Aurantiacibacter gangjinensis]APE27378.1 hypothetical protein BMF35_a0549 [Aurantiacibacter gangjinensis]KLE32178.1 hypothetical protein AAW01_07715 [Aurantiacibacter gangjinensis]